MNITVKTHGGKPYALVTAEEPLIADAQSALDLMVTVGYEADVNRIALYKQAVAEAFFTLGSGLAGDVLQKFVNYQVRLAIIGDYSGYRSKPLRDFIYESNKGRHVFFVGTEAEAAEKLTAE
jgi:hypothetical protein